MVQVENLTRFFGKRIILDNISFNVKKNEIVGFLGPNGAGKTTTMRIIAGFLKPTSGKITVAGFNGITNSLEARKNIGYLPENVPLYTDMTVRSYLVFTGRLKGLDKKAAVCRTEEIMEKCHLEEYSGVLIGKLSKGFRQRVGFAQAVIHDPQVVILDEPTSSIDPIEIVQTRELIKELGKTRTIILSTHILSEINVMCDRVIVINQGKIIADDRIENLSALLEKKRCLKLKIDGPPEQIAAAFRNIDGILNVLYEDPWFFVEYGSGKELQSDLTEVIVSNKWKLFSMEVVKMEIEDIFLDLTNRENQ